MKNALQKISVSVVEDDAKVRQMLVSWIRAEADLRFVSEWSDGLAAVKGLPQEVPNVVLMDINLPGLNGIQCVSQLKPALPETQFLMLTVYEDANHIYDALAAGASGYLMKETRRADLIAAIHDLHAGNSPMTGSIARKVVRAFQHSGEITQLSQRQRQVLEMLAQGYIYKEIADQLQISVTTVSCYIRRIYEKLHVQSRGQAVAKYAQIGSPISRGKL
jgi:DNA-binding NarL/FixJ family response regulator